MPTPLIMEWVLITNGNEKRLSEEHDIFIIKFNGYKLFPIDETIEIKRNNRTKQVGIAKIVKLVFENNQTICHYQLLSLQSVN
ncbi:DUF2584 family protein [Filobacillus milosensis]|uniref:DUF2584 family protein n=1 Tax=Filobacillus milosensis TaxID=94137 RepID=A0A4Y8IT99_9BACI|nr:DUF2584 family protein [Filobacillus milosensis]TFB24017.1 DUF2584 family protein [Filobacillus milosensis]